ncbi:MAG: hypothetical protein WA324_18435 [Bryobacteraceae bacterium]
MFKYLMIAPVLLAASAIAQNEAIEQKLGPIQVSSGMAFGAVNIATSVAGPMTPVTGAPYSADTSTERIQILADGNRIEENTTGSVARDSQGRMRREESVSLGAQNGEEAPHIIMIDDPVGQVHWTLDAQAKTAAKMSFHSGPSVLSLPHTLPFFVTSDTPGTMGRSFSTSISASKGTGLSVAVPDSNVVKTDLGTQTMEGVAAKGTRLTRTIPAGEIGNEEPIVITTETWYSPDLKVLVMSKSNDPRMGETIYKLTNIQRSEPSPTLFQPPDDYTVKDQSMELHLSTKNP